MIPITPDSSGADLPGELSNTGKIVVKKRIAKIEKSDSIAIFDRDNGIRLANGKMLQRKKKGRLYSLGGNDPPRKGPRGRLDRLKTVGTFDLGSEVVVLSEVARNLNEKIISGDIEAMQAMQVAAATLGGTVIPVQRRSSTSGLPTQATIRVSTPNVPRKDFVYNRPTVGFVDGGGSSATSSTITTRRGICRDGKVYTSASSTTSTPSRSATGPNVLTQHSADDCLEKPRVIMEHRKVRSCSTSGLLVKTDVDLRNMSMAHGMHANHRESIVYPVISKKYLKKGDVRNRPTHLLNISIEDSNRIEVLNSPVDNDKKVGDLDRIENAPSNDCDDEKQDSPDKSERGSEDKIESDIASPEDKNKSDRSEASVYRGHKPQLRKSKRIVRTDSELFDETHLSQMDIVLQPNLDIQIHNEPDYVKERYSSAASSAMESRKESSDIDDICSPRDPFKSTDDSSRNISTDEIDTVFSDSTDLEQLEREYRELARSTLQREYKSDGDTLDEVGKKRNDYQKWKNQSFETNFELYNEIQPAPIDDDDEEADGNGDQNCMANVDFADILSPESLVTYSTTNSSETSSTKRTDDKQFFSRINLSKENLYKLNSPRDSDTSTVTSPIKLPHISSHSIESSKQTTPSPAPPTSPIPCPRPSKLDIVMPVASSPKETHHTLTSLFEKRFGKFKINKLIKCKRFSASALYDKQKEESRNKAMVTIAASAIDKHKEKTSSASRLFRSKFSPSKSSNSGSKSSLYSSKLSLFSSKTTGGRSSFFSIGGNKQSAMFSNASHSNNELRTSIKTKLSETSKSNSEINKYRTSPSRFLSFKRSSKKTISRTTVYKQPVHSPLSEEFYNKTGSVRLSAMELYDKFCSEDFGGLYKHEFGNEHRAAATACGGYRTWHEYRLEHRGLGAVKKYARAKSRLLKQKSEPKFVFRGRSGDIDTEYNYPKEEDEDVYEESYHYDEDEYCDEEGSDFYASEEGEEEMEDEEEELDEGEEEEEEGEEEEEEELEAEEMDEEEIEVSPYPMPESMSRMIFESRRRQMTVSELLEEDEESDFNEEFERRAYHSENDEACGGDIAVDSDVDEIFLMPEGGKCSDYEQYGFENKHFALEHSCRIGGIEHDLGIIDEINYCDDDEDDDEPRFAYVSERNGYANMFNSDEILTIYKMCSRDDILSAKDDDLMATKSQSCSNASESSDMLEGSTVRLNEEQIAENAEEPEMAEVGMTMPVPFGIDVDALAPIDSVEDVVIERAESVELLSGSSGTIRSGSTLTEYAFDTVRNVNLDSCSTSKLSLSMKSEVFDDSTLTPDEPRVMKNCEFEDFTLTPEASVSEMPPAESSSMDNGEADSVTPSAEDTPSAILADADDNKMEEMSVSSAEVVVIVDRFLANERLLQQSIGTPVQANQSMPIDEQSESELKQQVEADDKRVFQFSSSISSSEEASDTGDARQNVVSTFTTEITKEFDLLFTRAQQDIDSDLATIQSNQPPVIETTPLPLATIDSAPATSNGPRIPTRHSMQKLEPYHIADDNTEDNNCHTKHGMLKTATTGETNANATTLTDTAAADNATDDGCAPCDDHSCIRKSFISKLKKNKSQSLGNLNKKTRCFPL